MMFPEAVAEGLPRAYDPKGYGDERSRNGEKNESTGA
jgi:hypothetical protein